MKREQAVGREKQKEPAGPHPVCFHVSQRGGRLASTIYLRSIREGLIVTPHPEKTPSDVERDRLLLLPRRSIQHKQRFRLPRLCQTGLVNECSAGTRSDSQAQLLNNCGPCLNYYYYWMKGFFISAHYNVRIQSIHEPINQPMTGERTNTVKLLGWTFLGSS